MIIDCKKYLFFGAKEELIEFFVRAQEEGFIEFLIPKQKRRKELPEEIRKFSDAIHVLRKQPVKSPYLGGGDLKKAEEVAIQVLELKAEIEKLKEEERLLQAEIARVAPFGHFSFDDIAFIESKGNKKVQFYCIKTSKAHEVETQDLIYVGTDYELDYYMGIHDRPTSYPHMIEMQFDRTVSQLKHHLTFVRETIYQVEAELKGYAGHIDFLRNAMIERLDIFDLKKAKTSADFPMDGFTFSIEGWVPENKTEKLWPLIEGLAVFFEPIAIEKEDRVPTYMENQNVNLIGEDLVHIYDTPAPTDKDPSGWVFWSFLLFFSMIIADGGYGLFLLGIAFFLKYKFPDLKAGKKRLLKLIFMLACGSIVWGTCTSGIFGIQVGPQNPISRVSLLTYLAGKKAEFHRAQNDTVYQEWSGPFPQIQQAANGREMLSQVTEIKEGGTFYTLLDAFADNILLELSLLVGVVHICLSLLRYVRRSWANIGWVSFAIGGYLYFPIYLKATSMIVFLGWIDPSIAALVGKQLIYGGIASALVLAIIQKRVRGLQEVTNMVQIFADILSYLRLYALALASTIMARTFNDMGLKVGLVFGSLIIVAGHLLNIQLAVMGGVIHGLRLNFIEWYHYSFAGEGKLFNPLKKRRQQIKQE